MKRTPQYAADAQEEPRGTMTTLQERPTETLTAVAEPAAAVAPIAVAAPATVAAPAAPPIVDISKVPETPGELLAEWDRPAPAPTRAVTAAPAVVIAPPAAEPKPLLHQLIAATLLRCWDAIVGPAMTDRERTRRDIAQHHGHADTFRPRI